MVSFSKMLQLDNIREEAVMFVPDNIKEEAIQVSSSLLPEKSTPRYEREYNDFKTWQDENNIIGVTEDVLLDYINQLSKRFSPNLLWSK